MADATSDNDVIKVLASSREAIRRWTDLLDSFYVTDASHHASVVHCGLCESLNLVGSNNLSMLRRAAHEHIKAHHLDYLAGEQ